MSRASSRSASQSPAKVTPSHTRIPWSEKISDHTLSTTSKAPRSPYCGTRTRLSMTKKRKKGRGEEKQERRRCAASETTKAGETVGP